MLHADYLGADTPTYAVQAGVAVPLDAVTQGNFAGLQRAVNAIIAKYQPSPLDFSQLANPLYITGQIDPQTRRSVAGAVSLANGYRNIDLPMVHAPETVDDAARRAHTLALYLFQMAGATPDFSPPSKKHRGLLVAAAALTAVAALGGIYVATRG